ncbi:MAG: TRAP transporter substrate-binding protein DctP [Jhaorihella sp.]
MIGLKSALYAATCVFAVATVSQPTDARAENWKAYSFISVASHPIHLSLEALGKEIEEVSEGKISVKVNVGGSLPITGTSITQAIGDGILTLAHDGYYTGNLPIGAISMLPMLAPDYDAFQRMVGKVEPALAEELLTKGVTLLATYNMPSQTLWGVGELRGLDDLEGLKLRVGNVPIAEFARRQGAIPVTLASGDVAPALERSVVGGIVTASAGGGRLWGDMLKYNYRLPLNYDLMLIVVNTEAFESLDPELQEKVREAARKSAAQLTADVAALEDSTTEELKTKGLVVTLPTDEEIRQAREGIRNYWPEWAKNVGPDAEKLLAEVISAVGE